MGKSKDLLSRIPKEYHANIVVSGKITAVSKIEYHNPGCGHISNITIGALLKRKQFKYCRQCMNKETIGQVYFEKIPQKYHQYISFIDPAKKKQSDKVRYINPGCGHESIMGLQALSQKQNFELCPKCIFKNIASHRKKTSTVFLDRIPAKYHKHITFLDGFLRDSKIIYRNPGCGYESRTSLGVLSQRSNLELCSSCSASGRLKNSIKEFSYYLNKIPEKYHQYISVLDGYGFATRVAYIHPGCGHSTQGYIGWFSLRKQFDRCHSCNQKTIRARQLSKDDMLLSLGNYLDDVKIIGGYPGNRTTIINGKCKKCHAMVENKFLNLQKYYTFYKTNQCQSCAPKNITQLNLYNWVKELCQDVEYNNRSEIKAGKFFSELDIYCPTKKFAVEYNGMLWHSEMYQEDPNYHYKKTTACIDKEITLLHVWGDKYQVKKDIYRSIIKTKLGVIENKISARSTYIRELNKKELKEFFDNNHLDDYVPCITGWGLFYNNKLVQAISVRKVNNQNKKYKGYLEIARMATLIDHLVVGGESRLLTKIEEYAQNKFKGILNYVSCDFGGVQKQKWKFRFDGITECSYCYTDGNRRISRQRLQKRKPGQTEKELAEELGLIRVNLTPNLVYVYEF